MRKIRMVLYVTILSVFLTNSCQAFFIPNINNLENLNLVAATQVFDGNGQLLAKLFEENRIVVSINNMSPYIQQAIVANEDSRFYSHIGVDPIGILRALWVNITTGRVVEGGSTITQQLAKNMFLTQERTIIRKIKEVILALAIERKFSKQEILQAYLNQVYFGEGAYGVEAASQIYFGKHASDLTLAESALLAGLPRGPGIYSPYVDSKAALARRAAVLNGMYKEGYITADEVERANREPIVLAGKKRKKAQASYFLDYLANEMVKRYGADRVYKGGLKIYTTIDSKMQQIAEETLGKYQGAIMIIDPRTGYIKAMVGGRNYEESQRNRALLEYRQPGSAFKPFVYAVALQDGLAANSVIIDEPIDIAGYSPQNYDKKYHGKMTLKKALRESINIAAVKLGQQVGIDRVLDLARSMGITSLVPQDNNLATALGGLTQGVNLYELTAAYTAFANEGVLSQPLAVLKVLDENDQVLEENKISQQAVLPPENAYILTNMLEGVIQAGTGTAANIGRSAAGKTGTTDNYETAWFIGYTPELLAGIYVGNDDRKPVGISGAEVAGLWGGMMAKILRGAPPTEFPVPDNVVTGIPICATSGKLAGPKCKEIEYSAFIKGTEPHSDKEKMEEELSANKKPSGWLNWKQLIPRLPSF